MKFLVQNNQIVDGPLSNYPKTFELDGVLHPIREMANKGHDVSVYGWMEATVTEPVYAISTHKLGDITYSVVDGSVVGEYEIVAIPLEERSAILKAACSARIFDVVDANAQMNLSSAAAAGLMSDTELQTYQSGLQWVASMRAAWPMLAEQGADSTLDSNWPEIPAGVQELANSF